MRRITLNTKGSVKQVFCGIIALVVVLACASSCKKTKIELSSDKYLTAFTFSIGNNPGVLAQTTIGADSVSIGITPGTALSNLTPVISFVGKSISPSATATQDFTNPVKYTITAQDGSTKTYTVVVRYLSPDKSITSFIFKASENPGLTKDVMGTIRNDSIFAVVPIGTDVSKLVPDITYNSHIIAPANETAQDFNGTVGYKLTALDLSTVTYKVVTGSPGTVYFGDQAGYLYALDAITGHVKWKFKTGGAIVETPALYKNMLIVGSGDSYAYAVDTAKGTQVWKAFLDGGADGETPDVANGVVYFSGGDIEALDANTGKEVWDTGSGYFSTNSIAVSGGVAYVMGGDLCYCLLSLDPATGNQLPRNGGTYLGDSNPAVANNVLYVQGGEELMQAFATPALDPLWTFYLPGVSGRSVASDPTVSNGVVYFCGYDSGGIYDGIYALDAVTGAQKWFTPYCYQRAPLVQNGSIWVTTTDHVAIIVLDSQTGKQKSTFALPAPSYMDPLMGNNSVYQSDANNNFYALDPYHGALKWQFTAAGIVTGMPITIDGNGTITRPGSSGEQN